MVDELKGLRLRVCDIFADNQSIFLQGEELSVAGLHADHPDAQLCLYHLEELPCIHFTTIPMHFAIFLGAEILSSPRFERYLATLVFLHCENFPFFGYRPRLSKTSGRAEEFRRVSSSDALSGRE